MLRPVILAFIAMAALMASPIPAANGAGTLKLAQSDAAEIAFWESIKDSTDQAEFEAYLAAYPDGRFAPLAKIRRDRLKGTAAPSETVEKPKIDSTALPAVVERVTGQAVTIMTTAGAGQPAIPDLPADSPFKQFFGDFLAGRSKDASRPTIASGFIYSAQGHVATTTIAVDNAARIEVRLADGRAMDADVIGRDPQTSIAVIKLRAAGPFNPISPGDSGAIKAGEQVFVVGNSGGLAGTVVTGVVSGLHRDINAGPYDDYIQTDQGLAVTQTGAPLFDSAGKLIGMVALGFRPDAGADSGLAIPIRLVRRVADDLIAHGTVRRGWLGVRIQAITDEIAKSLDLAGTEGVLVADVTAGGPAAAGGLEAGDVIVGFGDRPIAQVRDLPRLVADAQIDATVDVRIVRRGQTMTKPVTIKLLDPAAFQASTDPASRSDTAPAADTRTVRLLGMTLDAVTPELRDRFKVPAAMTGAVVSAVEAGSVTAQRGIAEGDVITEVSQVPVASAADVAERLAALSRDGRAAALLQVAREGNPRFVGLPLSGLAIDFGSLPSPAGDEIMSVSEVQRHLAELGYDPGPMDGRIGERTTSAITAFQRTQPGMAATGQISAKLSRALRAALASRNTGGAPQRGSSGADEIRKDLKDLESLE